jgi:phage tail-like protein
MSDEERGGNGHAPPGNGNGEIDPSRLFLTGPGFGTVRFSGAVGNRPPPRAASDRALLRSRMPGIYQDEDFGMRFLAGLEELLDPVLALLDALPQHLSPDLAPADVLELVTGWLGIQLNESQPTFERREIVRHASELGRRRGTRRGLELALSLGFPALPLRVEDGGGVEYATDPEKLPEAPAPAFVVYCDRHIPEERQAAVARLIEQVKPAHVSYRLRVKAPRKPPTEAAPPAAPPPAEPPPPEPPPA